VKRVVASSGQGVRESSVSQQTRPAHALPYMKLRYRRVPPPPPPSRGEYALRGVLYRLRATMLQQRARREEWRASLSAARSRRRRICSIVTRSAAFRRRRGGKAFVHAVQTRVRQRPAAARGRRADRIVALRRRGLRHGTRQQARR